MAANPNLAGGSNTFNFEEALATVQTIVERLQQPAQPLQEALADYETGKKLIDRCKAFLDSAELTVTEHTPGNPG
jgi:exodeoxyribonuclease VII small subunit